MRQNPGTAKPTAESMVKDIRRRTRKHHSAEEKIRIVLEGLRGEDSIAERASITADRRLARSGSPATQRARPPVPRSKICGRKRRR